MARSIQDYDGVKEPIDSDYPEGDIADKTISTSGTKINRKSNADIHQFFMKIMRMSDITPNGLPDNEYNRLQLFDALWRVITFSSFRTITGPPVNNIVDSSLNELVNVDASAASGHALYLNPDNDLREFPRVIATNNSANPVDCFDNNTNTINGSLSAYVLAAGVSKTFYYDVANTNWIVA
jgi:hypothetical protein